MGAVTTPLGMALSGCRVQKADANIAGDAEGAPEGEHSPTRPDIDVAYRKQLLLRHMVLGNLG